MSFFLSALHAFFFCRILRWTVRVKDTVTHTNSMFLAVHLAALLLFSSLAYSEESKSDINISAGYAYTSSQFSGLDVEKYGDSNLSYHNFILGATYSSSLLDADFLYFLPSLKKSQHEDYYQTTHSAFLFAASAQVKIQRYERYVRPYLGVGVLSESYDVSDRHSLKDGLKYKKVPDAYISDNSLLLVAKYKLLEKDRLSLLAYYAVGGSTRFALGITYWFYEL